MNLWAVEYKFKEEERALLFEYPSDFAWDDVLSNLHPAIRAKDPRVTYIGEVVNV